VTLEGNALLPLVLHGVMPRGRVGASRR
jgi:hypothetical protein